MSILSAFRHKKVPLDLLKGKKVLDLGCGRHKLEGSTGLDQYPFAGVDVVHDLARPLPFGDGEFDAVYANQLLEHIDDVVALVYEVHRVLKRGGIFLVHAPYFRSMWAHTDPTHVRSFAIITMDFFAKGTWVYENYRFRDEAFETINVFIDTDYPSTLARRFFTSRALKNPWAFENSIWSNVYPFQQISYLLVK